MYVSFSVANIRQVIAANAPASMVPYFLADMTFLV